MDTKKIKAQFPIFKKHPDLLYLDSSATALKPQAVVDAMSKYYEEYSANVKRGIYAISEKATEEYENARKAVADLINASPEEVIFTRNTTESINLVMYAFGTNIVKKGDEVVVSIMEHHSNFVPWQQLCLNVGADFKIIGVNDEGRLDLPNLNLESIVTKKTKILALTHISNVLGVVNPVKEIIKAARKINQEIIVLVDGAQAVPRMKVDVKDLDCDFYAFSGHKMLGPTGIGVLWGRKKILEGMDPFIFGGEMISEVKLDHSTFAELPDKFEGGTPAIAEAIGLGAATKYLQEVGLENIFRHEKALAKEFKKRLRTKFGKKIRFYGPEVPDTGILSFTIEGAHPHDLSSILNEDGVAIRAGNHCAMPLHDFYQLAGTARISLYLYNSVEDIEKTVAGIAKAISTFS